MAYTVSVRAPTEILHCFTSIFFKIKNKNSKGKGDCYPHNEKIDTVHLEKNQGQ